MKELCVSDRANTKQFCVCERVVLCVCVCDKIVCEKVVCDKLVSERVVCV